MNTLRNSVAIAALAIVVGYSFQARADILVMATDGVNTGIADDHATPGHTSYSGAIGNFTISYDLGAGFPGVGSPSNPVLDLTSLDLTTGTAGGTLTVSVTETDFTTTTGPMQFLSRQSRNQRGDSIVRRCQSCREPDDGVAHGAL